MRHLSTQSRADIYASDAIPTKRDDDGIACFYRLDLADAYEAGFKAAQKIEEPAKIVSHPQYDTQQAAKGYIAGRYVASGGCQSWIKFTHEDMEHAFKAGSDWQRDKLAPMFVPTDSVNLTAVMQAIDSINATIKEAQKKPDPFTAPASKLTDEELFAEIRRRTPNILFKPYIPRKVSDVFKSPYGVPGEGEV